MSFRRLRSPALALGILTSCLAAVSPAQEIPRRSLPQLHRGQSKPALPSTVTQGNWSQLAKFLAPSSNLNNSVAISGNTLAISQEPFEEDVVAYVYLKTAQGWRNAPPAATLSGPVPEEPFTSPIAIDGDTLVVTGVIGEPSFPGYAFVYVKPPGGWANMQPTAILTPTTNGGDFGCSVAISGDTIVIGANGFSDTKSTPGSAYVFVKPAGGWQNMTQTAILTASDALNTDAFGYSVAISGNTIAVGAPQSGNFLNPGPGKAYVFVKPSSGWSSTTQTAELTASGGADGGELGSSIAIDGDVVITGAPVLNHFFGAVLVFDKPAAGWTDTTQTATLTAADATDDDFGFSVGLSGGLAAVGVPYRGLPPNEEAGGIYIFQEPAGGWQDATGSTVLNGADAHYHDQFGYSVAISGKAVAGSAQTYYPEPRNRAVADAYVFVLP
jgi:hypothetical protein